MKAIAQSYFWWPGLQKSIETLVKSCVECLAVKKAPPIAEQVVTDNGPQFTAEEFATFMSCCRVKHTQSSPYNPSTNGLAERFVQTMKQPLKASQSSCVDNFVICMVVL